MEFSPKSKKVYNERCCVENCASNSKKNKNVRFHYFPKRTSNIKTEWKRKLNIKSPTANKRVCSVHFNDTDYIFSEIHTSRRRLKATAIPSLNLPIQMRVRKQLFKETTSNESDIKITYSTLVLLEKCNTYNADPIISKSMDILVDNESSTKHLAAVESEINATCNTKENKSCQVNSGDIAIPFSVFIDTDKKIKTMCGLMNLKILNELTIIFKELYPDRRTHKFSVIDRIIMTTMKLKLDLSFEVLSILFRYVSNKACSEMFYDTLKKLSSILKSTLTWVTRDEIKKNMPIYFKNFENTAIVLDCTEILIEKPKCLKCRIKFYSQYKSNFTVKFMTGVTPGGLINFVSESYGGRYSDKAIFEQSNIVNLLTSNIDAVMVDKGFMIDDICNKYGINLIRPPFLRNREQLLAAEAIFNREIAAARVHIERMNERIKKNSILKNKLKWHLVKYVDDIFIVCCGLANLSSPILADDKFIHL